MASLPVPQIPSPDDVTIPSADGRPLKGWFWGAPDPRGLLIISHGLGEHGALYRSLAEYLVPTVRMDLLAIDFLGHGRSPGRRGHLVHYDDLIRNLDGALDWATRRRPGIPRIVLGHSNGGVVAVISALRKPEAVDGLILSNPAFRLKYQPPRHKLAVGHVLRAAAPWVTLSGPLPTESLSQDPLQRAQLRADRLMHTRLGPPLFFGMRDAGALALDRASEIRAPLLMLLGPDDQIIDPEAGRAFFERYGGSEKALFAPEGFRHDPIFERDRGLIYHAIAEWLLPLGRSVSGDPASASSVEDSGNGLTPSDPTVRSSAR